MKMTISRILLLQLTLILLTMWSQITIAHGGVGMEDDMCVINIGFLKAHFTVYQPNDSGSQEFCEDIPDVTNSVFVIDYLHEYLKELQVDFRIINDVNNIGVFANWNDISGIKNIEQHTVFYLSPVKQRDGVLTVDYNFKQPGGYIGIVTATNPRKEKKYHAVFYFQVGGNNYGYVPLIILLLILAQFLFWFSNRVSDK